jgi:hypothetical protein
MKKSNIAGLTLATILVGTLGCGGSDSPTTPTDPVDVTPVETVTDTFQGSISQSDTSCHHFETSETANITMKLTDVQPLTTLTVGMGIGLTDEVADGSTEEPGCTLFATDNSVRVPDTLLSSNLAANRYCVCVFDVGNIFEKRVIDYTIEVEHALPPVA